MNRQILIGNTGKDAVKRTTPSGDELVVVSLATNKYWKDRESGKPKSTTTWHNLVFPTRMVKRAEEITQGTELYVEGETVHTKNVSGNTTYFNTEVRVTYFKSFPRSAVPTEEMSDADDDSHQVPARF